MLLSLLFLAGGIVLLVLGAGWLVGGSSALARRFGVSELVVGLTVVASGTSAPELVVSVVAALSGNPEIAVANVVGSNIFNILVILGAAAVIAPIRAQRSTAWREIPIAVGAAVLYLLFLSDSFFFGAPREYLARWEAVILLVCFGGFVLYSVRSSRAGPDTMVPKAPSEAIPAGRLPQGLGISIIATVVGIGALTLGARVFVDGAVTLATTLGVPTWIVGVTVVAVGTSLPELFTSLVAARRGQTDIALGNAVGSNIFNVFLVLGAAGVIHPVVLPPGRSLADGLVALAAMLLLLLAMFTGKRRVLDRWEGWVFLLFFASYVGYQVLAAAPG
ncbi:MAG: calcium/sodium antiporter [Spirochaetaceae bacterium]